MVAYQGAIEPLTNQSQWPKVDLGFGLQLPLAKRSTGRHRKLRFKGCLEKEDKEKKPIQLGGKNKCKRCGELGHRQSTCSLNGAKKRKGKSRRKGGILEEDPNNSPRIEEGLQNSPFTAACPVNSIAITPTRDMIIIPPQLQGSLDPSKEDNLNWQWEMDNLHSQLSLAHLHQKQDQPGGR